MPLKKATGANNFFMTLKQKIHQHYLHTVTNKIAQLQQVLADLKESGANETKSTAGDKHETALAMLQIEQATVRQQLKETQEQLAVLHKIDAALTTVAIVNGSLVKTNRGYLFLCAALGKAVVNDVTVTSLSAQSPLGKQLLQLKKGQTAVVNKNKYEIENFE